MLSDYFSPKFLKEVIICNGELVLAVIFYNLLGFLVPLVRFSFWTTIIALVIVSLVLFGLKFVHSQVN
ncbi:hypothetical protein [Limosilactobacillus panis]|uniref:Uncharacterized protein n=1 Tax=Limosilactobacillus panis TaxID=47493 RepID=A0ABT7VMD1_9LACO|nr:hypothetical protein [Limosilactobacillus panis]MDM8333902.1 hypothetical protein [Limosilactobacillus panis]